MKARSSCSTRGGRRGDADRARPATGSGRLLDPVEALATLPIVDALEELVRGAGTYRSKARALRSFAEHVRSAPGGTLDGFLDGDAATVRRRCLDVWGIGPETADAIVLYAARRPTFVVDAYARRLLRGSAASCPRGTSRPVARSSTPRAAT